MYSYKSFLFFLPSCLGNTHLRPDKILRWSFLYRMSCLEERLSRSETGQQSWKAQDGRYNVFFGTVTRSKDESNMEDGYSALNDVI